MFPGPYRNSGRRRLRLSESVSINRVSVAQQFGAGWEEVPAVRDEVQKVLNTHFHKFYERFQVVLSRVDVASQGANQMNGAAFVFVRAMFFQNALSKGRSGW